MLNRNKLMSMRRAASRDDWPAVGAIYLDLSLEAAADRFQLESLAPLVRLRDGDQLTQMINATLGKEGAEE